MTQSDAPAEAISMAEARERYAKAKEESGAARTEDQQRAADDPPRIEGVTRGDVEAGAPLGDAGTEADDESAQRTIDLGDGMRVSLKEVRDGFMLKADHTRKTQALAAERRQHEAERIHRLRELDQLIGTLVNQAPRPKSLKQHLAEDPAYGLARFAEQTENLGRLAHAARAAESHKARAVAEAEAARDQELAETYEPSWAHAPTRQKAYAALSAYALSEGAHPDEVRGLVRPWMIRMVDKAAKYDALQKGSGKVARMIADKPRVVRPGAKHSTQALGQAAVRNAHAKLKSSGSLADAVALIRTIRARGGG